MKDEEPEPPKARRHGYEKALVALENRWKRRAAERGKIMQHIIDTLWDVFGEGAFSWVGFYLPMADGENLSLGPHRDKPACSPIGMHGVCGRAAKEMKTQIVADVRALGPDRHVECDPANRSEIAVPVRGFDGRVFAVLDIDSKDVGAFDEIDARWLERIIRLLESAPSPR